MNKNIYVGNLPFQTTSDDLLSWFSEYGAVSRAQVAMDRETNRSRGFGFVEMTSGGDEAINALNGSQVDGRTLKVNEAKPREQRSGGPSGGGRPRSGGYGGGGNGGGYGGGGRRW